MPNLFIKIFLIIISIIVGIFLIYNSLNFKLDASSDTLILQNDEDFKYFNYYNEVFPNKNFLVLAIKSKNKIDQKFINSINNIKSQLSKIEYIDTIFTISDAPILIASKLKLSDLNNNEIPTLKEGKIELSLVLNEFSESPIFQEQIISKNQHVSALIIYPKIDQKFYELKKEKDLISRPINNQEKISKNSSDFKIINSQYRLAKKKYNERRHDLINKIRSELKELNIPYEYFLGGIDMIADDTISYVKKDIFVFGISVTIFLIIVLYLIFRNIKWVFIPLISTCYSILIMTGIIGALNWEITAISSNFISLMLILSISMNVHIINRYRINYSIKNHSISCLSLTMKDMFYPCLYTSLTTIVAFGSLLFSDIKPVIDFGKIMIVALSVIFISSFTILPLIISLLPKIKDSLNLDWKITNLFFQISLKKTWSIIILNILILIISFFGIKNLNVENSFINYFKKDSEIYKGMKLIDQELGGTTPLDIIIKFKEDIINNEISTQLNNENDLELDLELNSNLFSESDLSLKDTWFTDDKIETIKNIHTYLEDKNEIGKVQSIYSLIQVAEKINQQPLDSFTINVIYNKMPEEYKKLLISPFLSTDKNMIKISARILDSEKIKRNKLINDIRKDLSNKFEIIEEIKVNGLLVLYNNMLQSLFSSQFKSFGIVLILIFIMFIFLFHSIKISIAGIIPNIFASSFILGLIGISGIPLDIMTITVAAITIGIAVDNSIHYLYSIRKFVYEDKLSVIDSIKKSHKTVGQAVLTTSLTIAFGFSVLCLSNFVPTIFFGLFTSIAMIIAMLGVLITLPAIINKINL